MDEPEAAARLQGIYEAFNRGDPEAVLGSLSPDFELQRPPSGPHGGEVVRGREALREFMAPDAFAQERETPLEFVEGREGVLVRVRSFGRGTGSGVEIEQDMFHVWRMQGERPTRIEIYLDYERAKRAAGVP